MHPTNLTPERNSFVGRERELSSLRALIAEGQRLITVLGPPGAGKTRICRRLAAELAERDPTWFVDLTAAQGIDDLLDGMSDTLGLDRSPSNHQQMAARIEQLGRALSARGRVHLVLDNLEQIAEPAATVLSRFLDAAPKATFIATSRDRLRIEGEHCVDLSPLDEEHAVRLFCDRARAARREVAEKDRSLLAEIVNALDRLPLAIELAAGRMGVMPPEALLERLRDRQLWLASTRRDVTARQASLRGAVEWSFRILSKWETVALCQCAVFRGGFSLHAAQAVLDLSDIDDAPPVDDALAALVDRSLLRSDRDRAEARFSLYEMIRELSLEKLALDGHATEVEARHARYYLHAAESWAARTVGPDERANLERLFLDRHNLLAAHAAMVDRDPRMAARLVLTLEPLALHRGTMQSFLDLVGGLLSRAAVDEDSALSARLLRARAESLRIRGRTAESLDDLRRARARAKSLTDPRLLADIVRLMSPLEHAHEDGEKAEAELAWAADVARERGDDRLFAELQSRLGHMAFVRGEIQRATERYGEALAAARRTESPSLEAVVLCTQGSLALALHRFDEARLPLERALRIYRTHGDRRLEGVVLEHLATIHHEAGELDRAEEHSREALALHREVGDRLFEGPGLFGAATIELSRGDLDAAEAGLTCALEACREVEDLRFSGFSLGWLGVVAVAKGDLRRAREHLEESLAIARQLRDAHIEVHATVWLAVVDAREGQTNKAAAALESLRARGALPLADLVALARASVEGSAAPMATSAEGRIAARILRTASPSERHLRVAADGRWFELAASGRVDLLRRRALRMLVAELARARVDRPGAALSLDDLLAAGWPGERMRPEAGAARVYAAIRTLRKLGLRDALATSGDGYLLDPEIGIAIDR